MNQKTKIKLTTLQNRWLQFIGDNISNIKHKALLEDSDHIWYFTTDLFLNELSKEYNSEMLKNKFEEIIFGWNWDWFIDQLFKLLEY